MTGLYGKVALKVVFPTYLYWVLACWVHKHKNYWSLKKFFASVNVKIISNLRLFMKLILIDIFIYLFRIFIFQITLFNTYIFRVSIICHAGLNRHWNAYNSVGAWSGGHVCQTHLLRKKCRQKKGDVFQTFSPVSKYIVVDLEVWY